MKDKPSRREPWSNWSTQLWVDRRKCTTDGWVSLKTQNFMKDVEFWLNSLKFLPKPKNAISPHSFIVNNSTWKESATFTNISSDFLLTLKITFVHQFTRFVKPPKKSVWILGSRRQLPSSLSILRLTFRNRSGGWNWTWIQQEWPSMLP